MQGKSFSKDEYQDEVKRLSTAWGEMSADDREAYAIEAHYQQARLDELETQPLQTASAGAKLGGAAEEEVWRNAAKKRSCRRLRLNQAGFEAHDVWNQPTSFGDSL